MITKAANSQDNVNNMASHIHDDNQIPGDVVARESSSEYEKILHELQTSYPLAFPVDKTKIVSLKIGIRQAILANTALIDKLGVDEIALSKFMHGYVMRKSYLIKQITGSARYDLTGAEVGEVLKEHAAIALIRLERKLIKKQKRLSNSM